MEGSTAYTPASNGLAEQHVGSLLTAARAVLLQTKLPMSYWDYAVRHLAWCKNIVRHSKTVRAPYRDVMGHDCADIHHVRPFGCRILYHPVTARLPTFKPRLYEGVCIGHTGGGIYEILTADGFKLTKHVRAYEKEFRGMMRIRSGVDTDSENDHKNRSGKRSASFEPSSSSDSSSDDDGNASSDGNDPLIYVPTLQSTYGTSDRDSDEDVDDHGENDDDDDEPSGRDKSDDATDSDPTVFERPPGLRNIPRVHYTAVSLPSAITTDDEPKISVALQSSKREHWLQAIIEEFKTLLALGTWVIVDCVPSVIKIIPSEIIFKLKRDEHGRPKRFNARLVARGNLQTDTFEYGELYDPVSCIETVRILLAVVTAKGWRMDHLDIKGAFL